MSDVIRILHVQTGMVRAGIETMIMNYYRNIDRQIIQFDFAGYKTEKCSYDDEINALGGHIFYYPQYKIYNHIHFVRWWNSFLREHTEYKIIHCHAEGTYGLISKIAKKYGRYVIAHSHSPRGVELLSIKLLPFHISSIMVRHTADFFLGCSYKALLDKFGRKIANNPDKAFVLHNAIDILQFRYDPRIRKKVREDLGVGDDTIVIGTVGRIEQPKNPFFICKIIKSMCEKELRFHFLWLGTGTKENKVKRKLKKYRKNVSFLGVRDNVNDYLQAMDIFIFPSIYEGLGMAAVEAQASGTPTILSESCPKETVLTDICHCINRRKLKKWCDTIELLGVSQKTDTSLRIIDAGYDISKESDTLVRIYKKLLAGELLQ